MTTICVSTSNPNPCLPVLQAKSRGITAAECQALADIADLQGVIDHQKEVLAALIEASRPLANTWVVGPVTSGSTSAQNPASIVAASPAAAASSKSAQDHAIAEPAMLSVSQAAKAEPAINADINRVSDGRQDDSQAKADQSESPDASQSTADSTALQVDPLAEQEAQVIQFRHAAALACPI